MMSLILFAIFFLIVFVGPAIALYTDWLWFQEVGFVQVFTTSLSYKVILAVIFGALFAVLLYLNVMWAAQAPARIRISALDNVIELPSPDIIDPLFRRLLLPGALLLGLFAGPQAGSHWELALLFLNSAPFGVNDPVFGHDLGFYVFRLPALRALYNWLSFTLVLTFLATAVTYLLYRGIQYTEERGLFLSERARTHLLTLIAAFLVVKAGGYLLDSFNVLYSTRGVSFGASYTDVHAVLPSLRGLVFVAVAAAGLTAFQLNRPGFTYLLIGVGAVAALHLIGLQLYPNLLQRFRVVPNEIVAERPFIERGIEFTRRAYGLDRVESLDFPAEERLTAADLKRNDPTIKNVRLWDHRPLLATYAQLQEIRTYYKFVDVDNDRYRINGNLRQVMLSPRELSHQHLPSRIWINEHLTYTHGYGVVFGPVNQVTQEGLPEFFIKDIPPVSTGDIKITRPQIYFGELANDYVIVRTKAQELDYPSGDQNIYTSYEGRGGVPISSFWRKLIFSARYATLRILLSDDVTRESRILYNRQIQERVKKIAPFITYDRDPYLVISKDGRLFWIVDAYTTSNRYPYSQPTRLDRGVGNYIRNSVKVIVDAYNGTVVFYVSDPQDPIVVAYSRAFPGLFEPLESMPEDLRLHIRYPQDLFEIQARIYATYHMQDPQVFYNKEDLLSIPRRTAEGRDQEMDPYYTIMRLPGEDKEEFVLLLPFTPNNRDNMRAWLAARSDPPHYGKLMALDFPKARLVYGPKQIEARINQDTFISQQISLWNQQGSQVIRGSLLAIPIERSLLYVQPLYLAASDRGSLPELKRVLTAFGNQIAMEETLEESLQRLFSGRVARETPQAAIAAQAPVPERRENPAGRALEYYTRAQEHLRQGNWAGYGEEQKKLEGVLKEMQKTGQ
jgi:uncharacterized membrane protein (UPF0182 family)